MRRSIRLIFAVASFLAPAIGAHSEGAAQTLPGGASSLNESYDNWTVACRVQDVQGKPTRLCQLIQVQTDKASGKRLLEIDVQSGPTGMLAALILPFGLSLQKGVQMQVDTAALGPALPFLTCLPVGCVVRADLDTQTLSALKAGNELKLLMVTSNGQPVSFSLPLKGFAAGLARLQAIVQ